MNVAKIIPVFKDDVKIECNNYRSVSLIPNMSTIFEKLMQPRLTPFLENNKKFFKFQFAFRNNHSKTHALISLTKQIRNALDNNNFSCGISIDLQKEFVTANHKILS